MAPHVLIIAGGISGLCMAHRLKKYRISFHIYEKDSANDYRAQGYCIRIAGVGSDALQYLLDDDTMSLFELTRAEMKLGPMSAVDAVTGEEIKSDAGPRGGPDLRSDSNPPVFEQRSMPHTVDRTVFREVLLRGLKDHISYNHAFANYASKDGGIIATYSNGKVVEGSLLVGADGARSAVKRKYLPCHGVVDTEGRMIYGKTHLTPDVTSAVNPLS